MKSSISAKVKEKLSVRHERETPATRLPRRVPLDAFTEDCPAGEVIGSKSASGVTRKGIDAERGLGIDNGALRLRPLRQPGWARAGIAYGPFARKNGLAFAVHLLNGHNTSQTGVISEGLWWRLIDWIRGSNQEIRVRQLFRQFLHPLRLLRWLGRGKITKAMQRIKYWIGHNRRHRRIIIDENMAIGFFPHETPGNPLREGNNFVVHALGPANGELWVRAGERHLPVVHGLQNLQLYLIVILRERGAADRKSVV